MVARRAHGHFDASGASARGDPTTCNAISCTDPEELKKKQERDRKLREWLAQTKAEFAEMRGTATTGSAQNAGQNASSIISVSATSAAPTMLLGGALGEILFPPGGGVVGALLGSTFGTGGNISYVPSTDSYYAGPTVTFSPVLFSGTGATVSDVFVPRTQNPNSIASGTSFSTTFQPTLLTGSTVTKSPGSGPAVAGPAIGTKLPVSFGASHNWDVTPAVKYVTGVVNRTIETVKSWF